MLVHLASRNDIILQNDWLINEKYKAAGTKVLSEISHFHLFVQLYMLLHTTRCIGVRIPARLSSQFRLLALTGLHV